MERPSAVDRVPAPGSVRVFMACLLVLAVLPAMPAGAAAAAQAEPDPRAGQRRAMVADLRRADRHRPRLDPAPRLDGTVLAAMERVPRHRLVPPSQVAHAYANRPLPIGYGQTISQPYIVALMTTLARPRPGQRVLEIGTGSGYQAAVLAELVGEVYSIEIIEPLAHQAQRRLHELGYRNIRIRIGDGYHGWPEAAPFDTIVVTAAAPSVPPPLLAQLKPGGRMVIPVGGGFHTQTLMLVEKDADGRVRSQRILPVRFVPLTRGR
jgi:protein-L-isoaspartate(D-aspartate) O-methyltransferase